MEHRRAMLDGFQRAWGAGWSLPELRSIEMYTRKKRMTPPTAVIPPSCPESAGALHTLHLLETALAAQAAGFADEIPSWQLYGQLPRRTLTERLAAETKRWAEEELPKGLVRRWRERVDRLLARCPFTPEELAPLDAASRRLLATHPHLAYGSTLLAVVVAPGFILYLQLGDGDLLTVSAEGEVERPILKDARLIGNETTSLYSAQAWNELQVRFQTLAGAPPALILAATDGYANAFRNEAGFQQVAQDLWALLRDDDDAAVKPHLKGWLNEASQQGSGDDITVGLIWRPVQSPETPKP